MPKVIEKYWLKLEEIKIIFFEHKNSFTLQIINLEKLSVKTIKTLEEFTTLRRGIFDFVKSRISIQKRLKQEDLEKIFSLLNINVLFVERANVAVDKNKKILKNEVQNIPTNCKISFGKFKGKLYSDLPDTYLHWLSKNYNGAENMHISEEVMRRKLL